MQYNTQIVNVVKPQSYGQVADKSLPSNPPPDCMPPLDGSYFMNDGSAAQQIPPCSEFNSQPSRNDSFSSTPPPTQSFLLPSLTPSPPPPPAASCSPRSACVARTTTFPRSTSTNAVAARRRRRRAFRTRRSSGSGSRPRRSRSTRSCRGRTASVTSTTWRSTVGGFGSTGWSPCCRKEVELGEACDVQKSRRFCTAASVTGVRASWRRSCCC